MCSNNTIACHAHTGREVGLCMPKLHNAISESHQQLDSFKDVLLWKLPFSNPHTLLMMPMECKTI